MQRDNLRRVQEERINNEVYRQKIASARQAIFQWGKGIKSAAVENLLSTESYVPITVSVKFCLLPLLLIARNT